jgi:hypothetical protein
MSKSLSESAAEILKASLGAPKDPAKKIEAEVTDVGGAPEGTPTDNPGAKAASDVSPAAKPATKGDAKSVKTQANEEAASEDEVISEEEVSEEAELTEEEIEAYLDSLTEEELAALAEEVDQIEEQGMTGVTLPVNKGVKAPLKKGATLANPKMAEDVEQIGEDRGPEQTFNVGDKVKRSLSGGKTVQGTVSKIDGDNVHVDYGKHGKIAHHKQDLDAVWPNLSTRDHKAGIKHYTYEEAELTAEQIAEARAKAVKDLVQKNMSSCKEDVDALFNGESLSEEFRTKATTIFEAAVRARVEAIANEIVSENEKILADSVESIQEDLSNQVDEYMNHVVECWMEENQLAVETGLKVEITEDFINGLKNLFAEHYIEVPEDKADVVEEMAAAVTAAEEKLAEQAEVLAATTKALNEAKATEILRKICEGLTEVQVSKIKSLAEGVEFTTDGEYTEKLATIRENYFPSGKVKAAAPAVVVETAEETAAPKNSTMDFYVNAITKQLPK